jgi:hypothetical protein
MAGDKARSDTAAGYENKNSPEIRSNDPEPSQRPDLNNTSERLSIDGTSFAEEGMLSENRHSRDPSKRSPEKGSQTETRMATEQARTDGATKSETRNSPESTKNEDEELNGNEENKCCEWSRVDAQKFASLRIASEIRTPTDPWKTGQVRGAPRLKLKDDDRCVLLSKKPQDSSTDNVRAMNNVNNK